MKKILLGFIMDGRAGGLDTYLVHFLDAVWEEGMQIDLLTNEADPELKERLRKYHSRLFEIATLRHPLKQFRQVRYLISREKYDIAYFNVSTSMDMIAAFAAKSCRVPRRILHSHSGGNDCESARTRAIFNLLQRICRGIFYRAGNEYCGCSVKAGYWMFPKKIVESDRFRVIYNAVDRDRFRFRPEIRDEVRKELGITGRFVLGHAGYFTYVKNHGFLLRIFREVQKKQPDAVLLLAGEGARKEQMEELAGELEIREHVRFLGWRGDVDRLLQGMDVFVLPSWFEGLPTVAIEAQCTGLPCVISDSVTDECRISDRCEFVSLSESPEFWADRILSFRETGRTDTEYYKEEQNYDLEVQKECLRRLVFGGNNE